MKSIYAVLLLFGLVVVTSCKDDDDPVSPDAPKITAPASSSVQAGQSVDITFSVTVAGGYASSSATANGGTASIKSEPADDAKSGSVVVTFAAAEDATDADVTLSVTDNNSKSGEATATVEITEEPAKTMVDVMPGEDGTGTVTWTNDNIYVLRGFVFVNDGDVLTIEAGTVIKGQPGEGTNSSALIVAQGGKIMAQGTEEAPIIMTGLADGLDGTIEDDATQTWGGLILLGKATTNNNSEGGMKNIEGLPTTDPRTFYGGTDDADNSGVLTYVSVRHGGSVIGADNEINGISLGAVGSGTTIDHIEVFSNYDDGIEFFGGAVKVTNVVLAYIGDDGLDQDEGFHGMVQNAVVWKKAETNLTVDPRGGELDGGVDDNEPEKPFATPTLANITLYSEGENTNLTAANKQTFYMRDGWGGKFYNSIFYGFDGPIDMERRTDKINSEDDKSASCYDMWVSESDGGYGQLKIENNLIYTNGATTNDEAGFASVFVLSDETDDALELEVEQYLMENNTIADPAFGSGVAKFTPGGDDVTTDVKTGLSEMGLEDEAYKGAVEPGSTPFFANWTKTWSIIGN